MGRKVGQQFQTFGNLRAVVIDARGQAEQAKGFAAGIGAVEAPVIFLLPVQPAAQVINDKRRNRCDKIFAQSFVICQKNKMAAIAARGQIL